MHDVTNPTLRTLIEGALNTPASLASLERDLQAALKLVSDAHAQQRRARIQNAQQVKFTEASASGLRVLADLVGCPYTTPDESSADQIAQLPWVSPGARVALARMLEREHDLHERPQTPEEEALRLHVQEVVLGLSAPDAAMAQYARKMAFITRRGLDLYYVAAQDVLRNTPWNHLTSAPGRYLTALGNLLREQANQASSASRARNATHHIKETRHAQRTP